MLLMICCASRLPELTDRVCCKSFRAREIVCAERLRLGMVPAELVEMINYNCSIVISAYVAKAIRCTTPSLGCRLLLRKPRLEIDCIL